jgi:hypothetical protein
MNDNHQVAASENHGGSADEASAKEWNARSMPMIARLVERAWLANSEALGLRKGIDQIRNF